MSERREKLASGEWVDLDRAVSDLRDEVSDRPVYFERVVFSVLWHIKGDDGLEDYLRETLPEIIPNSKVFFPEYAEGPFKFQVDPLSDEEGAFYLLKEIPVYQ